MRKPEELAQSLAAGSEEAATQFREMVLAGNQLNVGPVFLVLRYQPKKNEVLGRFALNLLREEKSTFSPYVTGQLLYLVTMNYPGAVTGAVRAAFGNDDRTSLIVSEVLLCLTTRLGRDEIQTK